MRTGRRITVEVPTELLARAREVTGRGVTATVREGLRLLAASRAYADLRALRGKLKLSSATRLRADRG